MLDAATLTDHWLVQAALGPDSPWTCAIDEPGELIFVLRDGESSAWPAAVSVVAISDTEWPSEKAFASMREHADVDQQTVRLARPIGGEAPFAFSDIRIDGSLPGSPLKVDIWIDGSPRLHLAGVAAGPDLYELGRVFDAVDAQLTAAASAAPPQGATTS